MLKTNFTKKQLIESGIVLVIILLLLEVYSKNSIWIGISIVILFINLILPVIFYPFAFLWFNLSETLGKIVSKIVLGIIFYIIVVPIGIIRKFSGKDNLLLTKFKQDRSSVLKIRNYTYNSEDLNKPY
jgi:hypothetical protein